MHEDDRARNNWRDPAERSGGPAVHAWRTRMDRPQSLRTPAPSKQTRTKEARRSSGVAYRRRRYTTPVETCIALIMITALGCLNVWVGRRATAGEDRENTKKLWRAGCNWPACTPSPLHADVYMSLSSFAAEEIGQPSGDSRAQHGTNARKCSWRCARPASSIAAAAGRRRQSPKRSRLLPTNAGLPAYLRDSCMPTVSCCAASAR
jgi:hypothetical protein